MMKKLMIITTGSDLSLNYFRDTKASVDIVYFNDFSTAKLADNYDLIYIRDPFVEEYDLEQIKFVIKELHQRFPNSYFIDNINQLSDLMIEDKWTQYQLLSDFLPKTRLISNPKSVSAGQIAKKRISSRARAVFVGPSNITEPGEYIIQPMLKIDTEYRVYIVADKIVSKASIKSSKTLSNKVKVQQIVDIPEDIGSFANLIAQKLPQLDFYGLDIARVNDKLYLIEVNRACQFKKYSQLSGVNLVDRLLTSF